MLAYLKPQQYLAYSLVGILKVLIISFHFDRQFLFKFSRSLLNEMSFDFRHNLSSFSFME